MDQIKDVCFNLDTIVDKIDYTRLMEKDLK